METQEFRVILSTGNEHVVSAKSGTSAVLAAVEADGYPQDTWIGWSGWNVSAKVLVSGKQTENPEFLIVGDAYTASGSLSSGATVQRKYRS